MFDCTLRRESIYQYNNTRKNVNLFFSSNSRILTDHVYFFNSCVTTKLKGKKKKKKEFDRQLHTRTRIYFSIKSCIDLNQENCRGEIVITHVNC